MIRHSRKIQVFALLLLFYGGALAQISPGKLHRSHAFLEGVKNCTKCHLAGKKVSSAKCLACHKLLKKEIQRKKGLHANIKYAKCQTCHVDHNGRDYDLIWWEKGKDKFDHALTGYKLEGKHIGLKCAKCHTPRNIVRKSELKSAKKELKRTYLGLSQRCLSCHRDEHRGQYRKNCLKCHNMQDWKDISKFDHSKARFRLTGKHRLVKCAKCHKTIVDHKFKKDPSYKKLRRIRFAKCTYCHRDFHRGKLGKNCTKCHRTGGWHLIKTGNFDHSQTNFPLKGKHRSVACAKCHKPGKPLKGIKYGLCSDCHRDYHQGQFAQTAGGIECEACHTEKGFVPSTFTLEDHQKTQFKLTGSHLAISCRDCHTPVRLRKRARRTLKFRYRSMTCQSCHKNPHGHKIQKFMASGKCLSCHNTDSWDRVRFDHNRTKFKLTGKHGELVCSRCHKPDKRPGRKPKIQFTGLNGRCQSCHKDIHLGQFRPAKSVRNPSTKSSFCTKCHITLNWKPVQFDHNRDSRFALKGAHKEVACGDCHKTVRKNGIKVVIYKPLDTACRSCHEIVPGNKL